MAKTKKWKYHVTHSFKDKGKETKGITQLYQIGVYMIVDNNPRLQFNITPNQMVSMERRLKKAFKEGEITDLEFGREITVIENEEGFYEELKQ
jgi:hypothetical protein